MPDLDALDRAELIRLILELYRQNEQLRKQIEELRRKQHRSAAPFSKGRDKNNPKRPGRKPGQGLFDRRRAPQTEPSIPPIEVPLRQTQCPFCGGRLDAEEEWTEEASVTDMPSQPQPEANLFRVHVCRCRLCGKTVRGEHPEVAPGQYGATAHRLGPRVKAMAHSLHYGHGVPVRRLPAVLREMTGIELTQSAITQDALKQAEGGVGNAYRQLRAQVCQAPVVYRVHGGKLRGQAAIGSFRRSQKSSKRPLSRQHRRAMMALAPVRVQCIPARLRRVPIATLQPASRTPDEVQSPCLWNFGYRMR